MPVYRFGCPALFGGFVCWWIKNKDEWITGGGTAATGRVETRAAWAAKWSGLVRLTPAGLDGIAAVRSSALT